MRRYVVLILTILTTIYALDVRDIPNDLMEFFTVQLQLSPEEIEKGPQGLYQIGMRYYNAREKPKQMQFASNQTFSYEPTVAYRTNAVRYFIASALLGNDDAGYKAINILRNYPTIPSRYEYMMQVAKTLHMRNNIYGTFVMGISYYRGIGTGRNLRLAKTYLSKVADACQTPSRKTYRQLSAGGLYSSQMICNMAKEIVASISHRSAIPQPEIPKHNTQEQQQLKEKIRNMLREKQDEAIRKYFGNSAHRK